MFLSITLSFRFLLFAVLFGFFYCSSTFYNYITTILYSTTKTAELVPPRFRPLASRRSPVFASSLVLAPILRSRVRFSSRNSSRTRILTSQLVVTTRFRTPCWNSYETRPQQRATSRPSSRRHLFCFLGTGGQVFITVLLFLILYLFSQIFSSMVEAATWATRNGCEQTTHLGAQVCHHLTYCHIAEIQTLRQL